MVDMVGEEVMEYRAVVLTHVPVVIDVDVQGSNVNRRLFGLSRLALTHSPQSSQHLTSRC